MLRKYGYRMPPSLEHVIKRRRVNLELLRGVRAAALSLSRNSKGVIAGQTGEGTAIKAIPFLWAGGLTALVAVPWIVPGFLFGTDWPGPRRIDWPAELWSAAPVQAFLAVISAALSAEIASKLLVVGFLFVGALTAYRAMPAGDFVPRAAASVIYIANPFVYGRLHYGQFYLLAGYALLPWVASRVMRMVAQPDVREGLILALTLALVAAFTPHLLVPATLLSATSATAMLVGWWRSWAYVLRLFRGMATCAGAFVVLSAYWLIPYLAGRSVESKIVAQVGSRDLAAYSSVPDASLGLFPNLAGLYGFWAENVQRFPSLKLFVPYWPLALLALLILATIGASSVFLARASAFRELRWWVVSLLLAGVIGLLLEAGVAESHTAPVVRWLDAVFPAYRGMRDAGKWASVLAIVYAQLIPLGVIAIRNWLRDHPRGITGLAGAAISGLALALPLYYGNGLLFGMHGEIRPSRYPAGWYAADRVMAADPRHDRALFLPWHHYLRLSFVRNVNSVIASPAPSFFSVPVVVSADAEVGGIAPPNDPEQSAIRILVITGDRADWDAALAARNIKYVLVAKEVDWEQFAFFDHEPGFVRVGDYGSITLYRNSLLP
jgi:hypothetical protein